MSPPIPDEPGKAPDAGRIREVSWSPAVLVPLTVAVGLGVVGLLVWAAIPPGVWHDDGAYLLLGKSLAAGEGLRYSGVAGSPPGAKFPPLYPVFLALLWRVAPEAVGQGSLASLFNLLFVAVSGGLFVAYLRSLTFSWRSSVAAGVLLWLLPDVWRLAMVPLSEPLFLVALVAALWTGSRLEARPTWRRFGGFLAAFAVVYHTRSMGLAIGIAVPLALLMRGQTAWALRSAGGCALIIAPWMFWSGRAAEGIPVPLRDTLGPYTGWLASQAGQDGGSVLSTIYGSGLSLLNRVVGLLFPGVGGWVTVAVAALAAGMIALGVRRLSIESWTPIFTGALLTGMLWLWPYKEIRLVMPLIPILGMILVAGFRPEAERVARGVRDDGTPGAFALGTIGLIWMVWLVSASVMALSAERHLEPLRIREVMLARAVQAVGERAPPDGVVGAPELWSGLALHTGRRVAPSARFRPAGDDPIWGTPVEQFEVWSAAGIEYVVLENAGVVHLEAMDELEARCPGAVQLQASWGGGMLVHLEWDDTCRASLLSDR